MCATRWRRCPSSSLRDGTEAARSRSGRVGGPVVLVLILLVASACGASVATPTTKPARPVASPTPPLDPSAVFTAINSILHPTIRIEGSLRLTGPAGDTSPVYRLEAFAARSGAIWLRATAGPSGFELACDGVLVQLRANGSERILSVDAADLPLVDAAEPSQWLPVYALVDALLPALFPLPGSASGALLLREFDQREWRVTWMRSGADGPTTRRRAAVAVGSGRLAWIDTFGVDGGRLAHVEYGVWLGVDPYPSQITVSHSSGVIVEVEVARAAPGAVAAPGGFRLRAQE